LLVIIFFKVQCALVVYRICLYYYGTTHIQNCTINILQTAHSTISTCTMQYILVPVVYTAYDTIDKMITSIILV